MASSKVVVAEDEHAQLKYLGFVRAVTLKAAVLIGSIYGYAKQNSGSAKSKVDSVENSVRSVVGPIYERLRGVPMKSLLFLDRLVDEATHKFNDHAPPSAKKLAHKLKLALTESSKMTQDLAEEAKAYGPLAAISRANKISKHISPAGHYMAQAQSVSSHPRSFRSSFPLYYALVRKVQQDGLRHGEERVWCLQLRALGARRRDYPGL